MPTKRKKYNPNKLKDKVQTFVYEIRVWSESTVKGPIEESNAFAFPVQNTRIKADKYAFDFGLAAWAFVTINVAEVPALETARKLPEILDVDGVAALEELRGKLIGPCFGQMVRRPTQITPGIELADYCTVQTGGFRIGNAVSAADNTIGRLAS